MKPALEEILLGMEQFQVRLIRNKDNARYRETAEQLYQEKVLALERYGIQGLLDHYGEWLTVYQRLFPRNA